MKKILMASVMMLLLIAGCSVPAENEPEKVVVAYVTSWSDIVPDPFCMTHINYAFGHVNDSFDGVRIDNPERLKMLSVSRRRTRT